MKSLLIGIIKAYRYLLSPWLGRQCRFTPSCSQYGLQAIEHHGALRGSLLTAYRILRCNPFCRGGFDPVPGLDDDAQSTTATAQGRTTDGRNDNQPR
jgi:putative membrane protein insertion efficiency factor